MEDAPIIIKNMDHAAKAKKINTRKKYKIPERVPDIPFSWTLIGASGSGKSNLLLNILDMYKKAFKPKHIILISPSIGLDPKMNLIDAEWRYDQFDPELIEEVINQQKQNKKISISRTPNVLIILDDCISENAFNHKGAIEKLFYRCRHFNVSLLITAQKYSALSRGIRLNSKTTSFFKPLNKSEYDHIIKEHSSNDKISKERFMQMMDTVWSKPFAFLHCDYTKSDRNKIYQNCLNSYIV